jgi:hypothetical protein
MEVEVGACGGIWLPLTVGVNLLPSFEVPSRDNVKKDLCCSDEAMSPIYSKTMIA